MIPVVLAEIVMISDGLQLDVWLPR